MKKFKCMKKNKLLQVAFIMLPMLLFSLWGFGQSIKVQGTVTDEGGSPVPGVSVVIKGTTIGIVTDMNGKYQIEANGKSTLSFSFPMSSATVLLYNLAITFKSSILGFV